MKNIIDNLSKTVSNMNVLMPLIIFSISLIVALLIFFLGYMSIAVILCVVLAMAAYVDIKKTPYLLIFIIVLLPKLNLLNIPGTYVAIRSEDFFLLIITLAAVFYAFLKRKILVAPKLFFPISVFVFATFLSLLAGIYQGTIKSELLGFLFFLRRVEYFVPFFLAYWVVEEEDLPNIKKALLITYFVAAAVGIMQFFELIGGFFLGIYVHSVIGGRVISTFSGPHEYSTYLAMMFPLFLMAYFDRRQVERFIAFLALIFSLCLIFITGARTAVVAAIGGAFVFAFLRKKGRALLAVFLILLCVSIFFMPNTTKERFLGLTKERNITALSDVASDPMQYEEGHFADQYEVLDVSMLGRYVKWMRALQGFCRYPVFGLGPSAFGEAVDGNYFRILGENGIVGVLAFVWLICSVFMMGLKCCWQKGRKGEFTRYSQFVFTALIILLLSAVFIDVFEASKIMLLFWLLVGILAKINIKVNKSALKEEEGK
ncbi:O-antigen ligase family protein [Candidatus Margulisiibacteriota bacterium]